MTHTNSTNGARNDTSTASIPRLTGWRHSATWTYLIMLIASAVALGASFILSAETLQLARHPESSLGCDVNAVVSCSALAYSYWLSTQSLFVIHALCPWCLTLMFSTTIQFMALSHATVAVQGLPSRKVTDEENGIASDMPQIPAGLNKYYRLNIDLMVDVLWIVAIVVLIIVTEGAALFAA